MATSTQTDRKVKTTFSRSNANWLLWAIAAAGMAPAWLTPAASPTLYTDTFVAFAAYIAVVVAGGTWLTRRYEGNERTLLAERRDRLAAITEKYNAQVRSLMEQYDAESNETSLESLRQRVFGGRSSRRTNTALKEAYSERYQHCERQFSSERNAYMNKWKRKHQQKLVFGHFWGWVFFIGLAAAMVSFVSSIPTNDHPSGGAAALSSGTEVTYWNADNIPMPHLQDASQYVSNPDHVLSQTTVDHINQRMKQLDEELGVESAVIVVNHIENDDPYRLAQDVGNRYGVGRNDRGLMVVVGYEDHSINISPGRALEGDLTDAECRHLQQEYVIPGMRAEQPDSAMYYLADAIYATMKGKELPQMSALASSDGNGNAEMALGLYSCFMLAWMIFFVYKNKKYMWLGAPAVASLISNPFYVPKDDDSGFFIGGGGGGGGFSGGGGGFSGGSYGGGSFGGGGATSRW